MSEQVRLCLECKKQTIEKYCSAVCKISYRNKVRKRRDLKKAKFRPLQWRCLNCSKPSPTKWCTKECKTIFKSTKKERSFKELVKRIENPNFYDSREWYELRYQAFELYGNRCQCCGNFGIMHVDHIKPKSKYPELAYDINNLQILCKACNKGKSNKFETDWRK